MNCLVLNGNPHASSFDAWVLDFTQKMELQGWTVDHRLLRDMSIGYCTGCWSCWWATPGLCSIKDEMEPLLRQGVHSDLIIFASPLILGTTSALVKKVQDRLIPLVHPYIEMVGGECHHRRRYAKTAALGLIVEPAQEDTTEDLELVRHFHERLALNLRSTLKFCFTTAQEIKESDYETLSA